ncbi:MAG: 3-ketoacyl-CoA thiolase [Parachlamydiaceae bacterium]|nr:3-ketoacyl-CoA thiolase [Parachlamydiaceae bacterium]
MATFRKKLYVASGYNTMYFGYGRREFDPSKPMPGFESYLKEASEGVLKQIPTVKIDEGVIGSFMSASFLKQANLPGFLPFMVPELLGKPCTAVEGACGTGGRAIATAMRSVLSDLADSVFVCGFEVQNSVKSVYGADLLAGAAYYNKERKKGHAHFFPGIFSERAGAYYAAYGTELARKAMATWYQQAIQNARKNPKAQEYHNTAKDLLSLGMTPPNPEQFVPYLNLMDCSKISDGASALLVLSEKGLENCGISKADAVEIIGLGEAEGDITLSPSSLLDLSTTRLAASKALASANLTMNDIGWLEIHDCFSITALLTIVAIGLAEKGKAPEYILEGHSQSTGKLPTNLSGGLIGFGHPTGSTGVRQMVDLLNQMTNKAENQVKVDSSKPFGMMISMGGNDKTVTCLIVKPALL